MNGKKMQNEKKKQKQTIKQRRENEKKNTQYTEKLESSIVQNKFHEQWL